MILTCVLLFCSVIAGCGGGSCGETSSMDVASETLTTGTMSVDDAHGHVEISSEGGWFDLRQTGATDDLPFDLEIGTSLGADGGPPIDGTTRFRCANIPTKTLATSQAMSLASFCNCGTVTYCLEVDIFRGDAWEQFDLSNVDGTARVEAGGDPTGAGNTAVTIDVPETTVYSVDGTKATIAIDSMRGDQERTETKQSGSCGGGGGGSYQGWRPGGD